jgi:tetratricopeptide (TPR) repeat protein
MEARIHYQLGRLNFSRHEFEAARKNSRQAISLAQEWVDADGDTRDFRHLQEYQSLYGYALIELDQAEKGVRLIESALREMERIAASPEDEFTLAIHEALFASQLMELNLPKAIALGSDAVDRHYKLLIRDNVDYDIAMHASAAGMLSQALMKAGRLDEAEQILNSEGLAHPDRAEGRETMHSSTAISDWLVARGILQQKKGNHEKAIQCFRDAIQLLLTPNREIAIDWVLLPIQIQLAESLLQNEDNENAIDETRTAIQLMRRLIPVRQATPQLYHGDRKLFLDVASLCSKMQLYDELLSLMSDVFGNAIDDKVIVQSGLALISRALADDTNELRRCEWEQLSASLVDMQKRCRRQDSK